MCGITGKVCMGSTNVRENDIIHMNQSLAHRGPDDTGHYISPNQKIGLGHQRLSIIDPSTAGHQPMHYLERYWISYNGEIYNFQEKRKYLKQQGYKFVSNTDTEVIAALYDAYKEKCLQHMRGMFAFAIYDQKEDILFCARDRVGQKPFKYYYDKNVFIFASELKAILTQKEYKKQPDFLAIHHYLTFQYIPAPQTGFKNIYKLEPAHYLKLDIKRNILEKKRYWKLDYSKKLHLSEEEWQKRILQSLEESVRLRMISDVPLGAFLSGGVDSSAIVGMMSKISTTPIKTFSIGFKEQKYNELPYARQIAKMYKTDHTEFVLKPEEIDILPTLVRHYEEPYADSSAIPTYYLSKLTRNHVTVALTGDGGDENFAGYSRYNIQKFALLCDKINPPLQKSTAYITKALAQMIPNTFFHRAHRFSATLNEDYRKRYINYICYFTHNMKTAIYNDSFLQQMRDTDSASVIAEAFDRANTPDKLDQTLYADMTTYLPEDLLAKVDIASMAVSLEARSPFLDHAFLELTASMPFSLKLNGWRNNKYILKKALHGIVPDNILYRPKMGFMIPIESWFRDNLQAYIQHTLLSKHATISNELFNKKAVEDLINKHTNTNINFAPHIWALLTLELWFQEYFT